MRRFDAPVRHLVALSALAVPRVRLSVAGRLQPTQNGYGEPLHTPAVESASACDRAWWSGPWWRRGFTRRPTASTAHSPRRHTKDRSGELPQLPRRPICDALPVTMGIIPHRPPSVPMGSNRAPLCPDPHARHKPPMPPRYNRQAPNSNGVGGLPGGGRCRARSRRDRGGRRPTWHLRRARRAPLVRAQRLPPQ